MKLSILCVSCLLSLQAWAGTFVTIKPRLGEQPLSTYEAAVLNALLQDLGMALPDKKKAVVVPDNDPRPVPSPEPAPAPPPSPEPDPAPAPAPPRPSGDDSGFWDDDFFDDDKSYDQLVTEMDDEYERTVKAFDAEYQRLIKKWGIEKEKLKPNLPDLIKVTQASGGPLLNDYKRLSPNASKGTRSLGAAGMKEGDFHVLPGALALESRNQFFRGTCSAFTTLRAYESILAQYGLRANLSEQQYYALAKPKCLQSPCRRCQGGENCDIDGVVQEGLGLLELETASRTAEDRSRFIVSEDRCPYNPIPDANDVTQTGPGYLNCVDSDKIRSWEVIEVSSRAIHVGNSVEAIVKLLDRNIPVAIGVGTEKESDALQRDEAIVTSKLMSPAGKVTGGHAMLAVGYIRLPGNLQEGPLCLIVANSWGTGFGRAGHGCLTTRYLEGRLLGAAAIEQVSVDKNYLHALGWRE